MVPSIPFFVFVLVFAVLLWLFLRRRRMVISPRCSASPTSAFVVKISGAPEMQVEQSDIQYYADIKAEADRRSLWYSQNHKQPSTPSDPIDELLDVAEEIDIAYFLNEDVQNVHDTIIQDNLKHAFEKSRNVITTGNRNATFHADEIHAYSGYDTGVMDALKKINNRNAYVDNFQSNETDLISNVWSAGSDNVKSNLLIQLKECVSEHGSLHCPTGVASRIVSASCVEHPEKSPVTREILNQEILHKYSRLSDAGYDKQTIIDRIIQSYDGTYSPEKIKSVMDEWIEYV